MQGGLLNPWVSQTESRLSVVLVRPGGLQGRAGAGLSLGEQSLLHTLHLSHRLLFCLPVSLLMLVFQPGSSLAYPPFSKMLLLQPLLISPSISLFVAFLHLFLSHCFTGPVLRAIPCPKGQTSKDEGGTVPPFSPAGASAHRLTGQ